MPIPQDLGDDRPFAACKMQFSAIDGGTILTIAMSHSVADSTGTIELMRVLIDEKRFAQEHPSEGVTNEVRSMAVTTGMGQHRSVMRNTRSEMVQRGTPPSIQVEDNSSSERTAARTSTYPPL